MACSAAARRQGRGVAGGIGIGNVGGEICNGKRGGADQKEEATNPNKES